MSASEQQQAILDAALEILASEGPSALRVRDIAEAAGCTTMTVYSRFGGKLGVVEALVIDGFTRFTTALREHDDEPALERSDSLGATYRTWALANPGSYKVMFTEVVPGFEAGAEVVAVSLGSFAPLVESVAAMQADGHFRDGHPSDIAWMLWGLSHGLVMLELRQRAEAENAAGFDEHFETIYVEALATMRRGFAPE